jgi:hypothetical protein
MTNSSSRLLPRNPNPIANRLLPTAVSTLLLVAGISIHSSAQQPPNAGSTVTGHVFCADTNAPARFAKVLLKSAEGDHRGEEFMKRMTDNMAKIAGSDGEPAPPAKTATPDKPLTDDKKQAMAAASKGMNAALDMMNASTVGLNGEFKVTGVKPGTYYVHVIYAGYIDDYDQFSDEDFAGTDPEIRARIAKIPSITVTGTDSARADVTLERGAAISGRILFDDGSPAAGWTLSVIKPGTKENAADAAQAVMNQSLALSGAVQLAKSDDLGHFRITGLTPGEYAVRATMIAPSIGVTAGNIMEGGSGINLTVYSGSTFNRADAKPLTVAAGEEYSGAEITVPASSLHNITGHVNAKSDGHTLNTGHVVLTSKSNPALHVIAAIRSDGSFHFEYLPSGIVYTLTTADAADGKITPSANPGFMGLNMPNTEILAKYETGSTDVLLGDADIDSIQLNVAQTDWKPSPNKPNTPTANPADIIKSVIDAGTSDKP